MTDLVLYSHASRPFYCTQAQAEVLDVVRDLNAGGIGSVHGYIPSSGYVERPVVDIQILTRFSTEKLYARKAAALKEIEFGDVAAIIAKNPILSALPVATALQHFNDRKATMLESLTKTLDGDRSDAHRQGHDRCYVQVAQGVKVNLDCVKGADGIMQPVLHNGEPVAESIMLMCLELNRKVIRNGVRKVVKSGAPVLMGNAIESLLNKRSVGIMSLSLKADNFDKLVCSHKSLDSAALLKEADTLEASDAEKMRLVLEFCSA